MDWTIYGFMFPACIVIAAIAILSGISGAAMLSPAIILLFPLLHVPTLHPEAAIGMSLLTEFFGFASGVAGYFRRRLIDYQIARQMILVAVPFVVVGAVASHMLSAPLLKTIYGVMLLPLALVLWRQSSGGPEGEACCCYPAALAKGPPGGEQEFIAQGEQRLIRAADGTEYRYTACPLLVGQAITAVGALLTGMLSTGLGEVEMPQLVGRCRIPVPVAAGTSVLIVAAAVAAGSVTHVASLIRAGGLSAVPWNLVVYTIPGAIIGAQAGAHLQGKVSEKAMVRFMSVLFVVIGIAFLISAWRM